MLRTIILKVSKWNTGDGLEQFCANMKSAGIVCVFTFEGCAPEFSYCITDNRADANQAKALGIGIAVYLNEDSKAVDFPEALYCIENASLMPPVVVNRMYERFLGIPWEILRTERTRVREMCEEDLDAVYGIFDIPEVSKYTEAPFEDPAMELQYIKDYIAGQYRFFEYGLWMVEDESGRVIGKAGVAVREGYEDPEIGYVFTSSCWGKGYAYEVLSAVIDYAREQLEITRLNAFVIAENIPSVKLLRKLGFVWYGTTEIQGILHQWYRRE